MLVPRGDGVLLGSNASVWGGRRIGEPAVTTIGGEDCICADGENGFGAIGIDSIFKKLTYHLFLIFPNSKA